MVGDKNMEIILETLTEKIKELKAEIYFKDLQIEELKCALADAKRVKEAQNGNKI